MTRYQKKKAETLGDKQAEVKVNVLLDALVDTEEAIKAD